MEKDKKENTTFEKSGELETCSNCGQTAELINANYCFKCGNKLVRQSNLSK